MNRARNLRKSLEFLKDILRVHLFRSFGPFQRAYELVL